MSNTLEPTKRDVFAIAEYLGCNEKELWSEVSKLLQRQDNYARIDELERITEEPRRTADTFDKSIYVVKTARIDDRLTQLRSDDD